MFYYMYQITNNLTGKIYIGVHKTKNMNDDYMGSGKLLKQDIIKYGIENFSKVILEHAQSEIEMYEKEKQIVNEEFLLRDDVYNIKSGGYGGFDHINDDELFRTEKNKKARNTTDKILQNKYGTEFRSVIGKKGSEKRLVLYPNLSSEVAKRGHEEGWFSYKGKTHSEKTKKIIGQKNSVSQLGTNNSQFGTIWITNGSINLKIKNTDEIPDKFRKGRVIKK